MLAYEVEAWANLWPDPYVALEEYHMETCIQKSLVDGGRKGDEKFEVKAIWPRNGLGVGS